ncbi:MAG: phage protein [Pseudomonadota bacterium]
MPQTVATFDPEKMQIVIGTVPMSGFASGTFVTVEQDGNSFNTKVGADGDVARAKIVGRPGTMKLTLMATSISNAILTALHAAEGVFPISIKDGSNTVFAAEAWIEKPASFERGDEIADTEWTFKLAKVTLVLDGNP